MKNSFVKEHFIRNGLKTEHPNEWKKFIICNSVIERETEKAVLVHNTKVNETIWIPKMCLKPVPDESDFSPIPVGTTEAPSLPLNFATVPTEIEVMLEKCKKCGCFAHNKCATYNMATHFALLLCIQNDIEAKEEELRYANYCKEKYEEALTQAGIEVEI